MNRTLKTSLHASILKTVGTFGVLELLIFYGVAYYYKFSRAFLRAFIITQIFFDLGIILFLVLCSNFFYIINTGERLTRVNLANKITLLRISMIPSLFFLILAIRDHRIGPVLLIAVGITFLTDLIDGRVSRATKQVTYMGKVLDSVSDYALLLVVSITYTVFSILPPWLLGIVLFRFLFQAVGMLLLLIIHRRVEPQATIFGKIAVATTMILFAVEPLKLLLHHRYHDVFFSLELIAGLVVGLSVFDKGLRFYRIISSNEP